MLSIFSGHRTGTSIEVASITGIGIPFVGLQCRERGERQGGRWVNSFWDWPTTGDEASFISFWKSGALSQKQMYRLRSAESYYQSQNLISLIVSTISIISTIIPAVVCTNCGSVYFRGQFVLTVVVLTFWDSAYYLWQYLLPILVTNTVFRDIYIQLNASGALYWLLPPSKTASDENILMSTKTCTQ